MSPAASYEATPALRAERGGLAPTASYRPRMNYIALVNSFWAKDLEYSFTPNEVAVYFRLLERSNALGWKNPFNFSVEELLLKLRLRTKDPLDSARNRLKQAGLIDFKNGHGRGHTTLYVLADPVEREEERGVKNTPLYPPLSPTFSPTFSPEKNPQYTKEKKKEKKGNKTSTTSADASAVPEKKIGEEVEEILPDALPAEGEVSAPQVAAAPPAKPRKPKGETAEPEHFEAFWLAYPRHDDRAAAVKAFARLPEADQAAAAERAQRWIARRTDWIAADGTDYRPYPATWLNKRRWTELAEPLPTPSPATTQAHATATHSAISKPGAARHHVPTVTSYGKL